MSHNLADESGPSAQAQRELSRKLDVEYVEWATFQDTQAIAHASGILTFEESQTAYTLLGDSPSHFNGRDLAEKIVVTKLMHELMLALKSTPRHVMDTVAAGVAAEIGAAS
jgi:hypothetical protein